MRWKDLIAETQYSLRANKARTALTMLGIVIGIGSVIGMISLGQGASNSIQSEIASLGTDLILVAPGVQEFGSQPTAAADITMNDIADLERALGDDAIVLPVNSLTQQVKTRSEDTNTTVHGTTAAFADIRNVNVEIGKYFSEQQQRSAAKVAVIGMTIQEELFPNSINPVGQDIKIHGITFEIIGRVEEKGGSSFGDQDKVIYVPLKTMQRYLSGKDALTEIDIQAAVGQDPKTIQDRVVASLQKSHNIKEGEKNDFTVVSQEEIAKTASAVTGVLTALLGAIAGISLLVGGIGIMNMMLTSVTERTKEIGLRKAIGAKRTDITRQFLMESVVLTGLGGFIGLVFGIVIATVASKLLGFPSGVTLQSIVLAVGVSGTIGIVFGYYPARKAAALNPIEALRYQ